MEDRSEVRKPMPTPGRGALPLPHGLKPDVLDAMPEAKDLPGGHGFDGSVCAPKDIWAGGETAALKRLKVRARR